MTDDLSKPKEDWPIILIHRANEKTTTIPLPSECPVCGSKNVFLGSGNMKCKQCGVIRPLEGNMLKNESHGNDAAEELEVLLKEAGGERGLCKEQGL
jgi:hypothetical protein